MYDRALRWAPLTGPLFVVLIVAGFAIGGSSPDPQASDRKIGDWLGDTGHFAPNVIGFFMAAAAMMCLVVFFASLRSRIVGAEAGLGRLGSLAYGAGLLSALLFFIAVSTFLSPAFVAHDAPGHRVGVDVFRLTQDLGYLLWMGSVFLGAIAVWATSIAAFRTALLPRWFGWLGVVIGIVCLGALFFFPIFAYWLWILIAGVLLAMRPPTVVPAAAPAPVPAATT